MFFSHFRAAIIRISRNRFYAFINISGLSVGIITALFLMLYVSDELSFDRHHSKYKRIYRLESDIKINEKHDRFALAATPLGPIFKQEFPEVESFVRFYEDNNMMMSYKNHHYAEKRIFYADSTLFDIFDHTFIYGEPGHALSDSDCIVLTQSLAVKYFGDINPIDKIIQNGQKRNLKVTGVIEDLPSNSHLKFDAVISIATLSSILGHETFNSQEPLAFWNLGAYTYILLTPNSHIQQIHARIPDFYNKYMASVGKQINADFGVMTTRLDSTHHRKNLMNDLPGSNKSYVWIFISIAAFILILATINYTNIATARSWSRAKEVGIRKVIGGNRTQIMTQFFGESILLTAISTIIALTLLFLLLPSFNQLSGKELNYNLLFQPFMIIVIIGITIITGILSGIYPALYLSSFEPMAVLRGRVHKTGSKRGILRKVLVVFQFVISILMIMASITVARQISYLQHKDPGFTIENVMVCELGDTTFRKKADFLRAELLKNRHVLEVSTSNGAPGHNVPISVVRVDQEGSMKDIALHWILMDTNQIDLLKYRIVAGRNFDSNNPDEIHNAVIINEAAVKKLGWSNNPIGRRIDFGIGLDGSVRNRTKVIGVVKDFHYTSLHKPIEPLLLFIQERAGFYMLIKTNGINNDSVVQHAQSIWKSNQSPEPFEFQYLENTIKEQYSAERKTAGIFRISGLLSIFIALLGLLGLSSFVTEQRAKEIGIRKIMGAPSFSIIKLLYQEFIVLVLIAFTLSAPIGSWLMSEWLSNFAYHISLKWDIYVWSLLLALVIALITTSFHIWRASVSNPADTIKYE